MNLYVIYDKLAEECGPIYESKNDATALREFRRVFEKSTAGALEEYRLLRVGWIDRHTCALRAVEPAVEVVAPEVPR